MTGTGRHFDGREMLMRHDSFRREFALMPGLIRVAAGDHEQAQVVAEHIADVSIILHHHCGEDVDAAIANMPEPVRPVVREVAYAGVRGTLAARPRNRHAPTQRRTVMREEAGSPW